MVKSEVILGQSPDQHPSRCLDLTWGSHLGSHARSILGKLHSLRTQVLSSDPDFCHMVITENKCVVSAPWTCYIPGQRFSIRAMVPPMDTGYVRACFCLFQFRVGELLAFGSQGLGCSSTFYNAQDGPTIKNDQPQVSAVPGGRALL